MPLKAVFFDLDGTLLDTSQDLGCALNELLVSEGSKPLPLADIRPHVSNGASSLIKLGFGEISDGDKMQNYRTKLLDFYLRSIAAHTTLFDGINPLLEQCLKHNIRWGIVTNKPKLYTEALLARSWFASNPDAVVCPDHVGISKPDPAPLLHACELTGCLPNEAIYIGDHLRDIECGKNAGMDTIAVGYGFTGTPLEHLNWGATHNVAHASEIWPIINNEYRLKP